MLSPGQALYVPKSSLAALTLFQQICGWRFKFRYFFYLFLEHPLPCGPSLYCHCMSTFLTGSVAYRLIYSPFVCTVTGPLDFYTVSLSSSVCRAFTTIAFPSHLSLAKCPRLRSALQDYSFEGRKKMIWMPSTSSSATVRQ